MSQELAVVVTVHTDRGTLFVGPGPVDDDIAELITNPAAWATIASEPAAQVEPGDGTSKRPGKSASRDKWADHLDELGVDYDESTTKAQMIELAGD